MNRDEQMLETAIREGRTDQGAQEPARFFQAVRVRRRRVILTRVSAVVAAVVLLTAVGVLGFSSRSLHTSPSRIEPRTFAAVRPPAALQRLRELPPEIASGPGPVEGLRVLDARNPEAITRLGGT